MNNKQTYAVIGGGLLGMTLAYRLAQKGYKVTLYEAAPTLGGLASTWEIDGVTWDKFYHVILLSDSHTRKIIGELNLDDQMQWVETKTGFYTGGKLYSMSNTVEFLKFPPLSLVDKFRLGGTIFYTSKLSNWRRLEGIPVEKFLRRLSGNNTFEKMWLPLLRSKLGEFYKRTSAAFIWATIQRMYSARKSGLKKEMFGYMKGGYATILNAFVMKLLEQGVTIKSNHQVSEISKNSDGKIALKFNNDTTADFDKVISTIPSSFMPSMAASLSVDEKEKHAGIEYLGVICASVVLKKAISPYYVTNITDGGKPFTGNIEMTALVNPAELKGKHLVYLPKYVGSNDPIFAAPDADIIREFTDALKGMYPQLTDDDIVHVAVARAKNVFALSTLNYSQSLPPVASSIDGLYILNSAHITNGTLNVNETIQLAERFMEGM